jgi:hypothetical protein
MKHAADAVSIYYYSLRSHETFPQRDGAGIGPEEEEDVRGLNELMDRCFGFSFLLFFATIMGWRWEGRDSKKGGFRAGSRVSFHAGNAIETFHKQIIWLPAPENTVRL